MANKKYLDYAGLKRVLAKLLPGARKIWHGTEDEWNQLTAAERDKYDQAEIIGVTQDMAEVLRNPDWSRAVEPTMAQVKAGWTAPEDGVFIGFWNGQLDGTAVTVVVNGIAATRSGAGDTISGATFYGFGNTQIPVCKGDVLTFANISGVNQGAVTPTDPQHYLFVPYKVNTVLPADLFQVRRGTVTLTTVSGSHISGTVTFSQPMPDTNYFVVLEEAGVLSGGAERQGEILIGGKTVNGFNMIVYFHSDYIPTPASLPFNYTAVKLPGM